MSQMMQKCSTRGVLLIVVAILFLAGGCVQQKPTGSGTDLSPAEGAEGAASSPIFPHAEGWAAPTAHGAWVVQSGSYDACLTCHKALEPEEVEEETAPTCSSCHTLYPHPSDWIKKESHGNAVITNGTSACATQCHGYDLEGGLSGISCNLCHTIFPHSATWGDAAEHGGIAEGDGKNLCKGCHGDDYKTLLEEKNCFSCHENYPHADNWVEGSQHGTHVLQNGKEACASQCHGIDLSGGLSGYACKDCHDLYPHSDTWNQDHRAQALTLGNDICKKCHGDDFATILDGKNCYSCHPDYPHYPHPESPAWLSYTAGHGERVKVTHAGDTAITCEKCHGANLEEIKDGKNCFTCHASYPHEKKSMAWDTFAEHGVYTLAGGKEQCTLCHGAAYDGVVAGRANLTCFNAGGSCHATYPHLADWRLPSGVVPQDHGVAAYGVGKDTCKTANCHGVNFEGSANAQSCKDGACHQDFPHNVAGWVNGSASTHVPRFIERVKTPGDSACAECHGSPDYDRDMGGSSCTNPGCHPNGVTHKANWGLGTEHGVFYSSPAKLNYNSVDATGAATCTHCHGTAVAFTDSYVNALGGCSGCHFVHGTSTTAAEFDSAQAALAAQSSCYGCHWAYPHVAYTYEHTSPVGTNVSKWGPDLAYAAPDPSQTIHIGEPMYGHQYFIMRNDLMVQPNSGPGTPYPRSIFPSTAAINFSCGGSAGSCHFDGNRAADGLSGNKCSDCHIP